MRNKFLLRCTVACMAAVMTMTPMNASAATLLKIGSKGSEVKTVQTNLKDLGYYTYSKITGYYGAITATAVKRFQKENGLYADGIIGRRTLSVLKTAVTDMNNENDTVTDSAANVVSASTLADTGSTTADTGSAITGTGSTAADTGSAITGTSSEAADTGSVVADTGSTTTGTSTVATDSGSAVAVSGSEITLTADQTAPKVAGALDWYKQVRYIWDRGVNAVVTDIDTGKSFTVKRTYGTNHADVEPLTKEDTQIIKEIWGGFSWERRAVTVEVGDYIIAASMTGMPHAGVESARANAYVSNRSNGYGYGANLDSVKNNGCSGVLDIHFLNSKTHTTNVVLKSQQDMVKKAANFLKLTNL